MQLILVDEKIKLLDIVKIQHCLITLFTTFLHIQDICGYSSFHDTKECFLQKGLD